MTITGTGHISRVGPDIPAAVLFREPFAPSIVPYAASSSTSHATIAAFGQYTFEIQIYMAFQKGARVRAISSPTGSWMEGVVVSYSGTTLVMRPDRAHIPAAGPYTNWTITISGEVILDDQIICSGEVLDAKLVESNSLGTATFALKTLLSGDSPSPNNPVILQLPNGASRVIRAPLSLVLPASATLGVSPNQPFRLWFALVDDAGYDVHLGVMQTRNVSNNSVAAFQGRSISSTVSPPGNLSGIFYSDKTLTNASYIVLGFVDYDNGLPTAGVWNVSPNRFVFYASGNPLPGDIIGSSAIMNGGVIGVSELIPIDDSIPQRSEGAELMAMTLSPLDRMSVIIVECQAHLGTDAAVQFVAALFRSDRNDAMVTSWGIGPANPLLMQATLFLGHTNSTIFSTRAGRGAATGSQLVFNGTPASPLYGGTFNSFMRVNERMT